MPPCFSRHDVRGYWHAEIGERGIGTDKPDRGVVDVDELAGQANRYSSVRSWRSASVSVLIDL
jgi:hypothetical protein